MLIQQTLGISFLLRIRGRCNPKINLRGQKRKKGQRHLASKAKAEPLSLICVSALLRSTEVQDQLTADIITPSPRGMGMRGLGGWTC